MTLTLEDEETDRIARDLAALTGESVNEAVRRAVSERLEREQARHAAAECRIQGMLEAAKRYAALPDLDTRAADEIIGYDENGMW